MSVFEADTFFKGRIKVRQNPDGYRFSIDTVLLTSHIQPRPGEKVLDLGTGCGIIPITLACRNPGITIVGVEIQKELAALAEENVRGNHMEDRINILCMDMKSLTHDVISGPVDLIVSNPPYRKANSGRINPNNQRAVARHEIKITLNDIVEIARSMLRTAGRFITIYPAERMTDILTFMRNANLEPKLLCMIHSYKDTEAKLFIVEGVKGGRPGIKIVPPLVIYRDKNVYSDEVEEMFLF